MKFCLIILNLYILKFDFLNNDFFFINEFGIFIMDNSEKLNKNFKTISP